MGLRRTNLPSGLALRARLGVVIGETTALGLSVLMAVTNLFAGIDLRAPEGLRPIESITAGDLVWAMDPDTGEEDWREVLETFVHPDAVLELAIEDGSSTEVLTVTGGHPFWERERGWTPAGELLPGDEVFTSRGGWARIGGGTWIAGEQLVYNFEVEGAHTYFVGEAGAWVHNACALGDLTEHEIAGIQSVVEAAGRPLEVVGSAASGTRRAVGSELPLGKGLGTRSDIDYVAPPGSLPYFDGMGGNLPSIDPGTGIFPGVHNPHVGPAIRFEPGAPPRLVPGR